MLVYHRQYLLLSPAAPAAPAAAAAAAAPDSPTPAPAGEKETTPTGAAAAEAPAAAAVESVNSPRGGVGRSLPPSSSSAPRIEANLSAQVNAH